jgi:sulfopyruvate decarboxylase TPP-binding subunit
MFSGAEISTTLAAAGVTHVIWLPDSGVGPWESALENSAELQLIRVCREGEAWPLAAGLHIGGKSPVVVMQTTGLFESGDAMRNVLFDLKLPVFAIFGARSWLNEGSRDSAKKFALPILDAWGIDYQIVQRAADKPRLAEQLRRCHEAKVPGAVLIGEGRL